MKAAIPPPVEEGKSVISNAIASAAVFVLAIVSSLQPGDAKGNILGRTPALLEGSWEVTIKPRDCVSGAEAPSQFWNSSYFTFSAGGRCSR